VTQLVKRMTSGTSIWRPGLGIVLLVVLVILGLTLGPGPLSILSRIVILSIYALAYGVLLGYANQPSLGQSLFFGLGAYAAILPFSNATYGFWQAIGLSVLIGVVVGAATGALVVRMAEAYHVIVTALFASIANLVASNANAITGGTGGVSADIPDIPLGFVTISVYNRTQSYLLVLGFAVLSYVILSLLVRSPIGKVWQATRENEERALSVGYQTYWFKLVAFAICAGFTALSGALYATDLRYASSDYFGLYWSVLPFVWVLLGGIGTFAGPIIGVALFTVFQFYVSSVWEHYLILFGVLMLAILRWAPGGILGYLSTWMRNRNIILAQEYGPVPTKDDK
jgi:branched-chain amino acid transport system permease protein